ncbi:alpha/beta hydrolase [Buchananella hordeovulneris]|uniref:alpha/beta fold hydrolase n=1 Tax=Buchananella hordeovulneris TaxID=52770 RepID=UPI000F5DA052|nr:alpha/beta hydrolase [Buchananella hordeovulneris]RRD53334.1 alpha/beta hydrolase [Buchananella hordeovulneris]
MSPHLRPVAAALTVGGTCLATTVGFRRTLRAAHIRLASYQTRRLMLPTGPVTFTQGGREEGPPLVVLHGMFGGYDQGLDVGRQVAPHCRLIAPSRFGYPGTPVPTDHSPRAQAAQVRQLLDALAVPAAFILGASAGGTAALRFALDYPDRTRGLLLLSAALPEPARPHQPAKRLGPPRWLCRDFAMFALSPFFPLALGMPRDILGTMLPTAARRDGVALDGSINNPDMARHYDDYPVEQLRCPTLILQARDDKLAFYQRAQAALPRFPRAHMHMFNDGGHLIAAHGAEVRSIVAQFIAAPALFVNQRASSGVYGG